MGWKSLYVHTTGFIELELTNIKCIETKIETSCTYMALRIWRWIMKCWWWMKLRFTTLGNNWQWEASMSSELLCHAFPSIFLGVVTWPFRFRAFGPWLVKMHHIFYHFLFCRNRTLFHGSGVTILRNTALFCSFSIYRAVDARCWHWSRKHATASLTIPSKMYLFLDSCRLDLWEFPRFWTSGLKPLSVFSHYFHGGAT